MCVALGKQPLDGFWSVAPSIKLLFATSSTEIQNAYSTHKIFKIKNIWFCACAKNQFYRILRGAVRRIALIITNRRVVSRSLERRVRYYRPPCARQSEHRATTLRVKEVIIVITLYAVSIPSVTNNFAYYNLLDYTATVVRIIYDFVLI